VIYLSDNDIVEKLAVCNLLDDALAAYSATRPDVFVIPTLKDRIGGRSRAKAERRLGAEAVARILELLEAAQVIRDYSADDQLLLDDIIDIDAGEAILLSATSVHPDYLLLTGDKRCLKTLASCAECRSIAERVRGRIVCFEQTLLRIIGHFGFAYILPKVVPALSCDQALRAAFGSGMHSTEQNSVPCLEGYIAEIRNYPIDLLMPAH